MKIVIKILESILGFIFALIGAILIIPFLILGMLRGLPATVLEDIWEG